jgi:hypothetical protein
MTATVTNSLTIGAKVGESISWRRDITKGWIRKKTVSAFIIANYRIISADGQMLWLSEIDDVVAVNTRTEKIGNFNMIGTTGQFRYMVGQHKGSYIQIGDIHVFSQA